MNYAEINRAPARKFLKSTEVAAELNRPPYVIEGFLREQEGYPKLPADIQVTCDEDGCWINSESLAAFRAHIDQADRGELGQTYRL